MKPGRKRGLTPESRDLAKQLQEGFLGKILRFGCVPYHPQAQRVDPAVMEPIQALKSNRIALLGEPDRIRFR